jgi:hypothetical protein
VGPFLLAGHAGSDEVEDRLKEVDGCGCDLLERARFTKGDRAREKQEQAAREAQDGWKCPHAVDKKGEARHPWPTLDTELDEDHTTIRDAIERVIGDTLPLRTCPYACLRLPWVLEANRARRDRDTGVLDMSEPEPSAILLECMRTIDAGLDARRAQELRAMREPKKKGAADPPSWLPPLPPAGPNGTR